MLIAALPYEGCGWLLERDGRWRVWPVDNALVHRDPDAARRHFEMAPGDLLAAVRAADRSGERLAAMFHSHVGAPARPSAEDRRAWAPHGQPLYPDTVMLIASVDAGGVGAWSGHRWLASGWAPVSIETGSSRSQDKRPPDGYHGRDVLDSAAPAPRLPPRRRRGAARGRPAG